MKPDRVTCADDLTEGATAMTVNTVDSAQRNAATVAGLAFLISFFSIVAVSFSVFFPLNDFPNATQAAQYVVAHQTLFRLGITGYLVNCVALVALAAALYVIFRPVNEHLALLVALGRVVQTFTWIVVTINLFAALHVLNDADVAHAFGPMQAAALARTYLSGLDIYYVGLLFWSLSTVVASCLWFTSNFIPRALAAFGVISSVWCVGCTLVFDVFPGFSNVLNLWWFDTPLVLFELAWGLWLLFKGLTPPLLQSLPVST
jgi:hypothetical protein